MQTPHFVVHLYEKTKVIALCHVILNHSNGFVETGWEFHLDLAGLNKSGKLPCRVGASNVWKNIKRSGMYRCDHNLYMT